MCNYRPDQKLFNLRLVLQSTTVNYLPSPVLCGLPKKGSKNCGQTLENQVFYRLDRTVLLFVILWYS